MSPFDETALINTVAGNPKGNPHQRSKAVLLAQLELIQDEVNELREAIEADDLDAIRMEMADVRFTTYGLGHRLGVDADADYKLICQNNWDKFDESQAEAQKTRVHFLKLGIDTRIVTYTGSVFNGFDFDEKTYYVTKVNGDQTDIKGKKYRDNKWLKSHKYVKPMFPPIARLDSDPT